MKNKNFRNGLFIYLVTTGSYYWNQSCTRRNLCYTDIQELQYTEHFQNRVSKCTQHYLTQPTIHFAQHERHNVPFPLINVHITPQNNGNSCNCKCQRISVRVSDPVRISRRFNCLIHGGAITNHRGSRLGSADIFLRVRTVHNNRVGRKTGRKEIRFCKSAGSDRDCRNLVLCFGKADIDLARFMNLEDFMYFAIIGASTKLPS